MPLQFGRHLIDRFQLDPTITYLNHGTVGAPPRVITEYQRRLQDDIELQPAQFLLRDLADFEANGKPARPHMRVAAEPTADFVGCDPDLFGFVDNATTGCSAVLRSFPFQPGDEILITDLGYGGVNNAAEYVASRAGATVRECPMPVPGAPVADFVTAAIDALRPNTRLFMIDHIAAHTALVLPVAEIVRACRERGVVTLVDGAHVPGAIPLDVDAIGADFYVANLHKWLFTPRSCGFVATTPEWASILHPTVISWGYGNGIAAEFDLVGTRDPSPMLCTPKAIEVWKEWGGDEIIAYNHDVVWRGAHTLAEAWGSAFATPEEMVGPMVFVALPDEFQNESTDEVALRAEIWRDDRIEIPIYWHRGVLGCRVSSQIYVDDADIEFLADAINSRRP